MTQKQSNLTVVAGTQQLEFEFWKNYPKELIQKAIDGNATPSHKYQYQAFLTPNLVQLEFDSYHLLTEFINNTLLLYQSNN